MIPTSRVVTDPADIRAPHQILLRSHNSEWAALEIDCNEILSDPDLSVDALDALHDLGLL